MWVGLLVVWMGLGHATEADSAWSKLSSWRTWAVVENVSSELVWFAFDDVPGPQQRCEVGVFTGGPKLSPIVWCGPQARSDAGRTLVPKTLQRTERVARRALIEFLTPRGEPLEDEMLSYLGTFRRVSIRQFFAVEPHADASL
jgi:hypothetical protein